MQGGGGGSRSGTTAAATTTTTTESSGRHPAAVLLNPQTQAFYAWQDLRIQALKTFFERKGDACAFNTASMKQIRFDNGMRCIRCDSKNRRGERLYISLHVDGYAAYVEGSDHVCFGTTPDALLASINSFMRRSRSVAGYGRRLARRVLYEDWV
jgi:hypothetical protein